MEKFVLTSTEGYYIRQFLDSIRSNKSVIGVYAVAFEDGNRQVCEIHCYTKAVFSGAPEDDIEQVWDGIATLSDQIPEKCYASYKRDITIKTDNHEGYTEESIIRLYRNLLSGTILLDENQILSEIIENINKASNNDYWNQPLEESIAVDASSVYEKEDEHEYDSSIKRKTYPTYKSS